MFVVDKTTNRIITIKPKKFSDLGFKERENLQEWLEHNTEAFGEEFLFIQKEFDGFDDTRERLDLLALDKNGNIVVIENKLDDSGRDVTWQVLKYASYCSSLTKQQIKTIYQEYLDKNNIKENSENNIAEFLDVEDFEEAQLNQSQRIILVSGDYRKEVTSTVLWLLANYNLKIQCFKATPYALGEQMFLNIEQIIPVKEAEDYTIRMAEKVQEEQSTQNELKGRYKLRLEFWSELLHKFNNQSHLFSNISPSKDNWISAGSGVSGVGFNFVISKTYARTEVYMSRSDRDENKLIFDELFKQKDIIEQKTGPLEWQRLDDKKASRIKQELTGVNMFDKGDWEKIMDFLMESMPKVEEAFRKPFLKINKILKDKNE